jgi:hypothetical protein
MRAQDLRHLDDEGRKSGIYGRSKKPDFRQPPMYERSYAEAGVVAQRGRVIELRAPDPDVHTSHGWPRIWLTREAAITLHAWLGEAIDFLGDEKDST